MTVDYDGDVRFIYDFAVRVVDDFAARTIIGNSGRRP